jgi:hypothetical protein
MDDVRRDCEAAYEAAAEPKTLRWYDVEHQFFDIEASFDRLRWLSDKLRIPAIRQVLEAQNSRMGDHCFLKRKFFDPI